MSTTDRDPVNEDKTASAQPPEPIQAEEPSQAKEELAQAENGEVSDEGVTLTRLIGRAILATVVFCALAVVVSVAFHISVRKPVAKSVEVPVNEPAPILWQNVTAEKGDEAPSGVPSGLAPQVGLKTKAPEAK